MTPLGVPFRLDFCHMTVHCRPPGTERAKLDVRHDALAEALEPGQAERAVGHVHLRERTARRRSPPVRVAGWSQAAAPKPAKLPVVKKFAFAQAFAASTLMVPRAKKASWFDPWFEVPSFPLAVNHVL